MSTRAFELLLALFPRDFRERFSDDMRDLFDDQRRAARTHGRFAVARFWLRTILGIASAALHERVDAWRPSIHSSSTSDSMLKILGSDVRFAVRMLRKSPAFTMIAALVIALGTGAVSTIFSAMNAMLLRPLAGATAARALIRIERTKHDGTSGRMGASYPYYVALRDGAKALDGVVAWTKVALTLSPGDARAEGGAAVYGTLVSGNYFHVLGVRPALGRFFVPEEGVVGRGAPVIVVSHSFWRSRLGGDSSVIGRSIGVNGATYTLIGVAPPAFLGLDAPIKTDAWVPLSMTRQLRPTTAFDSPGASWLNLAGRLAPNVSRDAARSELVSLTNAWRSSATEPEWARAFDDIEVTGLTGLPADAAKTLGGFLALLLGAAALVLLIASVNVASMLSARAIARRREMALRAALGAGRSRLVRQLLTEVLALYTLGAIGGVALTAVATSALERMPMPHAIGNLSIALELSPDVRVFAFALGISLVAGLVFGLAPALRGVRADVTTPLRSDSAGASARTLVSNGLVVGQLALSLLLLVAAGLFLRALDRGARVDPGFAVTGVVVAPFDPQSWGYSDAKARAFHTTLRERVRAIPGARVVSSTEYLPLAMHNTGDELEIDGRKRDALFSIVGADYFDVLRLPMAVGRAIDRTDDATAPRTAVVNETFARRFWPDGSALGRTVRYHDQTITIVGVARDAKYASLNEQTPAMLYLPIAQEWRARQYLMVRADGDVAPLAATIRSIVRDIDPALPRPIVTTLREEASIVLLPQRVAAIVTATLGAAGLLLASVGLYGVVSYSVTRRTREIGIRVAIGARRTDVLAMVLRDGLRLAGIGVAIGVVLAIGASRLLASLLFDVSPLDVPTFGGMSLLLVGVALVASFLPARRAAAADPRVALRAE